MTETADDLSVYLSRIKLLGGPPTEVRRLGGLTNLNYLLDVDGERFVLRIPGAGTSEYIDRRSEEIAARSAAASCVNAAVCFFDPSDGLMLTRYVDGAVTMNPQRFTDLGAVGRAGRAFRKLHAAAAPFATDFQLFSMIDGYLALLESKGAELPAGYGDVAQSASHARAALAAQPATLVPSHCDPLCENFLDTAERMFIIDYEYAANNDPMWDLGDLSVEGMFGQAQDEALLRAYFGGEPPVEQVARMVIYKALCDLLWTLWGVIQHVNANPAEDFWAYAVGRFERCKALMATTEFAAHVDRLQSL